MRKILSLVILLLITASLFTLRSPFINSHEIKDLTFIRNIGVDKDKSNDEIKVTINAKYVKSSQSGQGELIKNSLSSSGKSIYEAVRNIEKFSDTTPYWAQVDYVVFGNELSKEKLLEQIDFFARQQLIRLDAIAIIAKDNTAETVLSTTSTTTEFTSDRLNVLFRQAGENSASDAVDLKEIIQKINTKYSPLCIPYIEIGQMVQKEKPDVDKNDLLLDGYAVFKNLKFVGFINSNLSKAYNISNGKFKSSVYNVKDAEGHNVSLEVIDEKMDINPELDEDGNLNVKIDIKMKSNIAEHTDPQFIINDQQLELLQEKQEKLIRTQIEELVQYSKENGLDMLNIWDCFYHKHPASWSKIKDNWLEIFTKASFEINADSLIRRTYNIKSLINPEKENK